MNPADLFHSQHYLRHNARRLEHLASLQIPVAGLSVLEVGAGIGDHSHYYLDRGCRITITEAREVNLSLLRERYPNHRVLGLDLESPAEIEGAPFDVIHCYGVLYHLGNPKQALSFLSQQTKGMLFLESCVSRGEVAEENPTPEPRHDPTQSFSGTGCRPTRAWILGELRRLFEFVYIPKTQPWHEEFPTDWNTPEIHKPALQRAIFIASREPIGNDLLETDLITTQSRHC